METGLVTAAGDQVRRVTVVMIMMIMTMMMMQPYIFPWEHESVASVQEALHCGAQYGGPSYAWHEAALLEAEESRDLSSTSSTASSAPGWPDTALLPAPAAYSFSPPPAPPPAGRLVTLPPRPQLLEHHQLGGEQLQLGHHHLQPSTSLVKQEKERRVRARPRSAHEQKESVERPCRVCGERAGKHSYYGGQVRVCSCSVSHPCVMSVCRSAPPAAHSSGAPCSPATTPRTTASRRGTARSRSRRGRTASTAATAAASGPA